MRPWLGWLAASCLWLISCQNSGPPPADPWAQAAQAVDQASPQAADTVKALWSVDLSALDRARYHFLQGELWYQQAKGQDQTALAKAEQSFLRVLELIEPGEWAERTRYNLALVRQKLDPAHQNGASGPNSPADTAPKQDPGSPDQGTPNQKSGQSGAQTGQNQPTPSQGQAGNQAGSPGQAGKPENSETGGQNDQAKPAAKSGQTPQQAAAAAKAAALQPKDLSQAVKPRADTADAALIEALKNDQKRQAEKSLLLQGGVTPVEKDW